MFRELAIGHPLIFLWLVCLVEGLAFADFIFYEDEYRGARWDMLVGGGLFFSTVAGAIVLPIAWLVMAFA